MKPYICMSDLNYKINLQGRMKPYICMSDLNYRSTQYIYFSRERGTEHENLQCK